MLPSPATIAQQYLPCTQLIKDPKTWEFYGLSGAKTLMYMYVYVYIYTHMYIHMYIHLYIYIYI